MKKILLLIFVVQMGVISCLKAQVDPHFSQIYAYPLWLNPALTGAFNGDSRVNANYKDQWIGVGNGYQTVALSADFKATDKVSLGLNLIDQKAGSADYYYFAAYGTFAYSVPVSYDGTQKLHFGLQAGFINRSFNAGDLQFGNQYNPLIGYDPNINSGESLYPSSTVIFDSGLGVYYNESNSSNSIKPFGGASIYHINDASNPFAAPETNAKLPIRFNVHGGAKITVSETLDITPSVIYIRQQQNQIRAIDVYADFKANDDNSFILGALYRYDDAIVPEVGFHLKSAMIGLSYDINTSALKAATNGNGGLELSLNYIFGNQSGPASNSSPRF